MKTAIELVNDINTAKINTPRKVKDVIEMEGVSKITTIECPECQCLGFVTSIDGLAQRTFCNNCGHELGLFSLKTEGRS